MCLIVFAWRPGHAQPLVAANRDESHARPSRPLGEWPEQPGLFAGRDLEAGGTWMGYTRSGRFAALTNIRDPSRPQGAVALLGCHGIFSPAAVAARRTTCRHWAGD